MADRRPPPEIPTAPPVAAAPGIDAPHPRRPLQRGIIILPSAFTMANLFFGIYAMVAASRGDFLWAGWFIVFAGFLDMLDGRVARFTRTGSNFGAELDSLVDAISFGVAPGFIIYQLYFTDAAWSWTLSFIYVAAVVIRLARFNVEQGGEAKRYFHGLPSPTAGMILATFYPFSQTPFFQSRLVDFPWPTIVAMLTILLGVLMVSHVPYPVMPKIGFRTVRGFVSTGFILACFAAAIAIPRYFIFLFLMSYTTLGLLRSVIAGLQDRLPDRDPLLDEVDEEDLHLDDAGVEARTLDYADLAPERFRPDPDDAIPEEKP
ncbi:MAG: CDP-diacylglycerol--serine O-phosphatidyltransferase [Gemmatimonadota bacterium]